MQYRFIYLLILSIKFFYFERNANAPPIGNIPLTQWMSEIPTAKSSHVLDIELHLRYVVPHLNTLLQHFGTAKKRKLKFGRYIKRQWAYDKVFNF